MTTLVDFRTRVQNAMGGSSFSTERGFGATTVDDYIQRAIEEYTRVAPALTTGDVTFTGGSRSATLTLTRYMRAIAAEYPSGNWPRTLLDFDLFGTSGDVITLDIGPPAANYVVRIYFEQRHLVDGSGSTIRLDHEDLIVEGAAALMLLARAAGTAQTADVSTSVQPGRSQHLNLAEARLRRWRDGLRSLKGLVRRELYTPGTAPVSKSLVTEF